MFGSEVLDVAIGLFVIFFVLSTVCSGINEAIAGLLRKRAATLEEGLRELLRDPGGSGLTQELLKHPLIGSLSSGIRTPSYIPSHMFAVALVDLLIPSKEGQPTIERLRAALAEEGDDPQGLNPLRRALLPLIDSAESEISKARESIEKWFDNGMDRVSGWYKRRQERNILIIALATAVLLNADTIMISNVLLKNPAVRAQAVELARQRGSSGELARADLAELQFPFGWTNVPWAESLGGPTPVRVGGGLAPASDFPYDFGSASLKLVGLLITTAAISLGAPFWFELKTAEANGGHSGPAGGIAGLPM
jgi:hypothetical protein